tara:strand:+ start:1854 stop:2156 length:303 start_codon:yes stop_codon:yes gene_type:complete
MTDSLFFLANKTTLEYNYLKVKNSRELIEISHPNKVDVIDSMKQTESDLENSINCWRAVQEEMSILARDCVAMKRENISLNNENERLKKVNQNLLNDMHL